MSDTSNPGDNPFKPDDGLPSDSGSEGQSNGYNPFGDTPSQARNSGQYDPFGQSQNPYQAPNYGWDPNYGQAAGFGQMPGYGQPQYNADPGLGVGQPGGELPPTIPVVNGPAKPDLGEALSVSFKLLNKNIGSWLGASVIFVASFLILVAIAIFVFFSSIESAVNGTPTSANVSGAIMSVLFLFLLLLAASFVLNVFINRGAFETIDGRTPDIGSFFKVRNWGALLGTYIIAGILQGIAMIPGYVVFGLGFATSAAGSFDSDPSPAGVGMSLLGYFLIFLASLAIMPITTVMPLLVMDGRSTAMGSLSTALNVVKPHYWMALLCFFVLSIISGIGAVVFYVGLLYTVPLAAIGTVFIYRQLIAGRRPVNV